MFASRIFLTLMTVVAPAALHRQRRYLVYPNGGPARAQFILGLGIPVDLKEQSVTVGTVIKFQYLLPTNSSEYTSRIYGFANEISRDMHDDKTNNNDKNDISTDNDARDITDENNELNSTRSDNDDETDDENTLVDITFDKDRRKRSLVYTEGGEVDTNDVSEGTEVPLQEAIRRQELLDQKYLGHRNEEEEEEKKTNRWDYYKILERMVERYGFTGRPCLLRTICEAASVPFTHESGLLAEIGHILFTPSATRDKLSEHSDNEYHAAERLGRDQGANCEALFPECEGSVLDTFTEIGVDTLHKFGLY
ncbi:uncharacterized protein LOC105385414 [Plutella xylostella]|uniref:uncharacterized protein LOC105385414 n=1 Tax=Plutella xylostella TaxID=51655 RepID=UPI002032A5A6|nr:uncharacterized protein LOC105385414 [Plutella xylostella]